MYCSSSHPTLKKWRQMRGMLGDALTFDHFLPLFFARRLHPTLLREIDIRTSRSSPSPRCSRARPASGLKLALLPDACRPMAVRTSDEMLKASSHHGITERGHGGCLCNPRVGTRSRTRAADAGAHSPDGRRLPMCPLAFAMSCAEDTRIWVTERYAQ
jgi:hypothetical protein